MTIRRYASSIAGTLSAARAIAMGRRRCFALACDSPRLVHLVLSDQPHN